MKKIIFFINLLNSFIFDYIDEENINEFVELKNKIVFYKSFNKINLL